MVNPETSDNWQSLATEQIYAHFETSLKGLSPDQIQFQRNRHGFNRLAEVKKRTALALFAAQFKDFMILLLLGAAVISAITSDLKDAIAITAILVLNAIIGFAQEYRAEKAMEALKAMSTPTATVIRSGEQVNVPAQELVPGDCVVLEAGKIIPADLRLVKIMQLKIDESVLTGESMPVEKIENPLQEISLALGDKKNMAFKGTVVAAGRGFGIVVATGMRTEFGKIAQMLQQSGEVKTPLQKRLSEFGKRLSWIAILICVFVFAAGVLRGEKIILMFMTAVSLAVAAIPEALPAVVTIGLAIGAKKMVEKNALIRRLPAVETLGSVTYICTDKTGTLTLNRMRVEEMDYGQKGKREQEFFTALAICNDALVDAQGKVVGDPTETALYERAEKSGFQKSEVEKQYPRVLEIPFDSQRKLMTTFHRLSDTRYVSYTKGAAEVILAKSAKTLNATGEVTEINRDEVGQLTEKWALAGLRVLGFSKREWTQLPDSKDFLKAEDDLTLLGFAGLLDPPREEAKNAVSLCKTAGIIPVMITGDHPATAQSIGKRVGILSENDRVISGPELEKLSEEDFAQQVESIKVYARVSPDQKLKIVKALQSRGQFVAMTGDGVNDAPALKRADIGVAMGITGTDVAKESAAMILLDDNFSTIVRAVKEGRRIYDNMRRFIRYAVTTNSAEVWIIFFAPFLGLPIPFLPLQILWINLLTDGLPGLALAAEPAEKNVMSRPPRPPQEGVFAHGLGFHVIWVGILMATIVLGTQAFLIHQGYENWRSFVFTLVGFSQLAHVLAIRSESESLFRQGLFSNKPLLLAVIVTFILQMGTLYVPAMNAIFSTAPLSALELFTVLGLSAIIFFAVEIEKWIRVKFVNRK